MLVLMTSKNFEGAFDVFQTAEQHRSTLGITITCKRCGAEAVLFCASTINMKQADELVVEAAHPCAGPKGSAGRLVCRAKELRNGCD